MRNMKKVTTILISVLTAMFWSLSLYAQQGDAENGAVLYSQKCAGCHGSDGGSLVDCNSCDSVESLYDAYKNKKKS